MSAQLSYYLEGSKVPTKADLQQEVNVMKKLNEALEDVLKKDEAISTLKE